MTLKMRENICEITEITKTHIYYKYKRFLKKHKILFSLFILLYLLFLLFLIFAAGVIGYIKDTDIFEKDFPDFSFTIIYILFFLIPSAFFTRLIYQMPEIYSILKEIELFLSLPVRASSIFISRCILNSFNIFLILALSLPLIIFIYYVMGWSILVPLFMLPLMYLLLLLVYSLSIYFSIRLMFISKHAVRILWIFLLAIFELILFVPLYLDLYDIIKIANIPLIGDCVKLLLSLSANFDVVSAVMVIMLTVLIMALFVLVAFKIENIYYKGVETAYQKSSKKYHFTPRKDILDLLFNYQTSAFIKKDVAEMMRMPEIRQALINSLVVFIVWLILWNSGEHIPSSLVFFISGSVANSLLILFWLLTIAFMNESKTFWIIKTNPINYNYLVFGRTFSWSLLIAPMFILGIIISYIVQLYNIFLLLFAISFSIILTFSLSGIAASIYFLSFEPNEEILWSKLSSLRSGLPALAVICFFILLNIFLLIFFGMKLKLLLIVNLATIFILSLILLRRSINRIKNLDNE